MGDKTIKKTKQMVTIKIRVVVTFGRPQEVMTDGAHKGSSGISGKVLFLDLGCIYKCVPFIIIHHCILICELFFICTLL